ALSSLAGVAPVWVAAASAAAFSARALARRRAGVPALVRAAEPGFLLFVLGLGVIVAAAGDHGLRSAVTSVLPSGGSFPDLLAIAALSAVLANLVNNLPATLILAPVAAALGPGPLLAMLIGVGVGPNLTYAGSLATLLWRRILRAEDAEVEVAEFTRLGLLTVPAGLILCTLALWLGVRGWG
ncbi:MAG TPA: ArsB/NhaD family transporter, partial [Solirubrobacteraceae bacterium]|nr:ArsB/NhaD family transporter [Solirubrobacteraceae bacterium]